MSTQLWPLSEAGSVPDGLFSKVKYFTTGSVSSNILELLAQGGARKCYCLSPFTSLLIVGLEGGEEMIIDEAEDLLDIPAVSCAWVVASCDVGCQLPVSPFRVRGQRLFSRVTVLMPEMAGLSAEDRERLWAMVTWHGGRVLTTDAEARPTHVTHVVTSSCVQVPGAGVRMVTPNWVVDSVRRNRLQDEDCEEYTDFVSRSDGTTSDNEAVQCEHIDKTVEEIDCSYNAPGPVNEPVVSLPSPEDFTNVQNELIERGHESKEPHLTLTKDCDHKADISAPNGS